MNHARNLFSHVIFRPSRDGIAWLGTFGLSLGILVVIYIRIASITPDVSKNFKVLQDNNTKLRETIDSLKRNEDVLNLMIRSLTDQLDQKTADRFTAKDYRKLIEKNPQLKPIELEFENEK